MSLLADRSVLNQTKSILKVPTPVRTIDMDRFIKFIMFSTTIRGFIVYLKIVIIFLLAAISVLGEQAFFNKLLEGVDFFIWICIAYLLIGILFAWQMIRLIGTYSETRLIIYMTVHTILFTLPTLFVIVLILFGGLPEC